MAGKSLTLSLALFCGLTLVAFEAQASNTQGAYSVEILTNGAQQPVYQHGGQSYVAGSYGAAYQIRVHNRSGRRIEAVVAVDGRDVVTGQPINPRRHRGYLVAPFSNSTIDGFRSSTSSVAAFRFSTIPESYAWRTGTSWGIGTIRVWVYEERAPVVVHPPTLPYGAGRPRASRSAPSGGDMSAEAAPQAMGTSYGEQRWSPVSYSSFHRRSRGANAVLGLRYNSYQMLAAAGIIAPTPVPSPVVCHPYYGCPTPRPGFAPPPPVNVPRRVYSPPY